jgi:hypothetical protein
LELLRKLGRHGNSRRRDVVRHGLYQTCRDLGDHHCRINGG